MKTLTGYDTITGDKLYTFLQEAYVHNEDIMIPKELLVSFAEACSEMSNKFKYVFEF